MTREIEQRFEQMLSADMALAEPNIMVKDSQGGYHVFGRFHVQTTESAAVVIEAGREVGRFTSVRTAVSWCIAEKYRQSRLAQEIERLDHDLERVSRNHKALSDVAMRMRDRERRAISEIKSREAWLRCQALRERLAECVARAKYFQIRGFNDEIARTRRPAPHRTNQPLARKSGRKGH